MMRRAVWLAPLLLAACAGTAPPAEEQPGAGMGQGGLGMDRGLPPRLPESEWGFHVLSLAVAPDGALWAGTYGAGVLVLRPDTARWDRLVPSEDDTASMVAGHVNSITFARDGAVWVGTAGSGFGRSLDGGTTWRKWTAETTGPQWQYVAARGIAAHGDTVYIATSDGLRMTWDGGERWRCVVSDTEVTPAAAPAVDDCTERVAALPTEYLLALDVMPDGTVWVGHLDGVSSSDDGGMTWRHLDAEEGGVPRERVRAIAVDTDSVPESDRSFVSSIWAGTETELYVDSAAEGEFEKATIELPGWSGLPGALRAIVPSPGELQPSLATSYGMAVSDLSGGYRVYYLATGDRYRPAADMWAGTWWGPPWWPLGASSAGINRILGGETAVEIPRRVPAAEAPAPPEHAWFARPIASDANPYVDGTGRYGSSTSNGVQRAGIAFNNPAGTPVHAIGDGTVVFAGPSGTGSNTVAIAHDRRWQDRTIFSAYHHNATLEVRAGDRVREGDVIATVGNTGRTVNDRLALEVHVAPTDDAAVIVNAEEAFPQYAVNPQLWIEPLPGTGIVAGRVLRSDGEPVRGAKVYGLVVQYPTETPFSYAEVYGEGAPPGPVYGEHFAVGDVSPGEYLLGVDIDGMRVWRRVRVVAGSVTFVEFERDSG